MEEQAKDLSEYLSGFKRRKKPALATAAVLLLIAAVVGFVWPPTYRSSATILIEEQEIPADLVRSTI